MWGLDHPAITNMSVGCLSLDAYASFVVKVKIKGGHISMNVISCNIKIYLRDSDNLILFKTDNTVRQITR